MEERWDERERKLRFEDMSGVGCELATSTTHNNALRLGRAQTRMLLSPELAKRLIAYLTQWIDTGYLEPLPEEQWSDDHAMPGGIGI